MQDRIDKVMEILARKGYRSVSELSQDLEVSEMTIRRYLDKLERKNLIQRTHGGAYTGQEMIEVDYRVRETVCKVEKEAIGRRAAALVRPGESIFIDAGSTTAFLAMALDDTKRLTVVTNSLVAAQALGNKSMIETFLLGGKIHEATHSLIGTFAETTVRQFRFTKAFLGASGVDLAEGLTQSTIDEIPIKKIVAANSQEVIVLVDSTKFGKNVLALFLGLDSVDIIVTDKGIKDTDRRTLEEQGIRMIVAE